MKMAFKMMRHILKCEDELEKLEYLNKEYQNQIYFFISKGQNKLFKKIKAMCFQITSVEK